jgi:hypothetical protein
MNFRFHYALQTLALVFLNKYVVMSINRPINNTLAMCIV